MTDLRAMQDRINAMLANLAHAREAWSGPPIAPKSVRSAQNASEGHSCGCSHPCDSPETDTDAEALLRAGIRHWEEQR